MLLCFWLYVRLFPFSARHASFVRNFAPEKLEHLHWNRIYVRQHNITYRMYILFHFRNQWNWAFFMRRQRLQSSHFLHCNCYVLNSFQCICNLTVYLFGILDVHCFCHIGICSRILKHLYSIYVTTEVSRNDSTLKYFCYLFNLRIVLIIIEEATLNHPFNQKSIYRFPYARFLNNKFKSINVAQAGRHQSMKPRSSWAHITNSY